jgi:hypothetical protein
MYQPSGYNPDDTSEQDAEPERVPFSFQSLSPLAAGTSLSYVAAGFVAGGEVKFLNCERAVMAEGTKGEKVKWAVPAAQVKVSSIESKHVKHIVATLRDTLRAFERRMGYSTGTVFNPSGAPVD